MIDTHAMSEIEATHPTTAEETLPTVEPAVEVTTESPEEECAKATETAAATPASKEEAVAQLKELAESGNTDRTLCDHLRVAFYKMHNEQVAAARQAFIEAGGNADDFAPETDSLETEFKELMAVIKEKRAAQAAAQPAAQPAAAPVQPVQPVQPQVNPVMPNPIFTQSFSTGMDTPVAAQPAAPAEEEDDGDYFDDLLSILNKRS